MKLDSLKFVSLESGNSFNAVVERFFEVVRILVEKNDRDVGGLGIGLRVL